VPNITLVGNSVSILKHSYIQNNVSNKRIVGSSRYFTILNFNCVGTTSNSCISGSRNFVIFLYFIHLQQKLNSLQRYDIAQNFRILHRVVQCLSQHNLKISHHRHMVFLKVVHPLKIYQYTKFHGPTLTGASFASTSEV
jgi:hypothetical protein